MLQEAKTYSPSRSERLLTRASRAVLFLIRLAFAPLLVGVSVLPYVICNLVVERGEAATADRDDGLAKFGRRLLWLLLGILLGAASLPVLLALPLLVTWLVPLPFSRVLFVLLAVRFEDLLFLLIMGKIPLSYNLRNLSVRWLTALLTGLAFTVVIGLLTIMMAFVTGMNRLTEGSAQPGNVIVLSAGSTDELFSNLAHNDTSDIERQPGVLRDEKNRPLCSREVYLIVNQPIASSASGRPRRRFMQVRGLDDPELTGRVHGLDLYPGGAWFSPAGVQRIGDSTDPQALARLSATLVGLSGTPFGEFAAGGVLHAGESEGVLGESAIQAVLGEGVARQLGNDIKKEQLAVGDRFEVGMRQWVVVGILKSSGSTFDSEIWAKQQIVGQMFGKENFMTSLVVRTSGPAAAQQLVDYLTRDFKESVYAQPESEYYAKLSETNKQFLFSILFVASVMAVGGIFGVMNTMFAAISQRTKDIGVLRLLGFTRWEVLASFLLESLLIALIGGLAGCALGLLIDGSSATSIVSGGQGGGKSVVLKLFVDANTLALGLLFTLIMGELGGLLPALAAMRLRPLESLR
jgi:ABC-type antimicrobial peptide transport system permease subunit